MSEPSTPQRPLSVHEESKDEANRLESGSEHAKEQFTDASSKITKDTVPEMKEISSGVISEHRSQDHEPPKAMQSDVIPEVTPEEESEGEDRVIGHGEDATTEIPLVNDNVIVDVKTDDEEDNVKIPLKKDKDPLEFPNPPPRKKKPPMYLFPLTRLKLAWTGSASMCEFFFKATIIIFSTLGWFFCIGGVPFLSIVMLIIGSVYLGQCNIQPNIPVYLIVSGVFGTIQHIISVWTRYVPRESQGRLKVYRSYCRVFDCAIQGFMAIWFLLGCIWVYSSFDDVEYEDTGRNLYCNKTLYLFAFWILNLSFILLALLIVLSLTCILCIVTTDVEKKTDVEAANVE